MYKQIKDFNEHLAGTIRGYCLQNVRKGYGIAAKYPNATGAWNNTQQHRDTNIPAGVEVPLFYSWKTDGHINVRLANGKVWSDGTIYPNLAAYRITHPLVKYLGWGESVNGVRVIEKVPEPVHISVQINPGTWNVRTSPNGPIRPEGPVLGGQKYGPVTIDANGWAKITFCGKPGYIGPKTYKRI